jgi:NADH-quinone oxidoreductase subunit M
MELLVLAIIFVPLLGAITCLFAPPRVVALATAWVQVALSVLLCDAFLRVATIPGEFKLVHKLPLVPSIGLGLTTGVDGLSVVMLLLSAVVLLAAVYACPRKVEEGSLGVYYACVLFIAAGAIGAFATLDLFFFYAFHELALIPTFIMIALWGQGEKEDRLAVAWKTTIYLAVGGFVLLLGLLGLFWWGLPDVARSFDMTTIFSARKDMGGDLVSVQHQGWIFLVLLAGFGTLISLFPLHSWAPSAYASAPTPVAMLHAGVLKKFGLYGLLRLALPLLPEGVQHYAWLVQLLLIGNIIYIGLATVSQKRLDMMLGYSSVMHMGYVFLGLACYNTLGVSGAALLMFAHGLSIALLFAIIGNLRDQVGSLEFSRLGGLARKLPFLSVAFGIAAFASIGLPGFANFASEIMVFFGAFQTEFHIGPFNNHQVTVVLALWGVVISAVYMLRAYRKVFFGELPDRFVGLSENSAAVYLPVAVLVLLLLLAGIFPQTILQFISHYTHYLAAR